MPKRTIELFISTDVEQLSSFVTVAETHARRKKDVSCVVKSVLDFPIEVVEKQIFYTPALLLDGKLVATGIGSAQLLDEMLITLL